MQFTTKAFGYTKENEPVSLYRLENASGAYIEVLDYGCRIRSICVPDKRGSLRDVCLGYDKLSDYETDEAYFGAAVGRCASLISEAFFTLNGKVYHLDKNDGSNHLHGGSSGFSFCLWKGTYENGRLIFSRNFPEMADGYPGNLDVKIIYEWTEDNQLMISYEAISDQDTILNVTNHTYFNLEGCECPRNNADSGQDSSSSLLTRAELPSIMEHELWVAASHITEIDANLFPTGNYLPVEDTPFDFRKSKGIGWDIHSDHIQLRYGCGYDHNFILEGDGFRKAAVLHSPVSGIRMTCYTDQPGLQLYTSNALARCQGKYGEMLCPGSGICLETQHFPNSIHNPHFPSVVLKANDTFRSNTAYMFDLT